MADNDKKIEELTEKSALSKKLERLKSASLNLISKRERLPQPLFWSAFSHKINEIREERKKLRNQKAEALNCDWLKS